MPNVSKQRGFSSILLVLIVLMLVVISALGVYYFLSNNKPNKNNLNIETPMPTSSGPLPTKLPTKTDSPETDKISKCPNDIDHWQYLPENLKEKTFKEGVNTAGGSTYDIFPLAWSRDCQRQAFLVELVGRGGDAYTIKDFKPRGLYIFDNKTKQAKLAYAMPIEFTLDEEAYESNFWFTEEKYIFVITTKKTKKEFIGRRYEYDVNSEQIQPFGE